MTKLGATEILEITGSNSALQGVGRAEDGRAVFVRGAIPGERVLARVVREKERFLEAEAEEILLPSPDRTTPFCPYYGVCGGCAAQHLRYERTLALKEARVSDALTRIGALKDFTLLQCLGMEKPFRMRNKAEYALRGGKVGLCKAASREILEIEDCLLQTEKSVALLLSFRLWLKGRRAEGYFVTRQASDGRLMAVYSHLPGSPSSEGLAEALRARCPELKSVYELSLRPRPVHALDGAPRLIWGEAALTERLGGLSYRLSPESFFQVNTEQAEVLYKEALRAAAPAAGGRALDAYCGAGGITLQLARAAARVTGVEIVPSAVRDARENARANHLEERAEFFLADAASYLPTLLKKEGAIDAVVLDPPRKGVDEKLISALTRARPRRVAYVSCDPGTLARDLKKLCAEGPYRPAWIRPVDMFPWTEHVETVAALIISP